MTPTATKNGPLAPVVQSEPAPEKTPWEKLRAPFPANQIGKLPRSTKRDNPKGKCRECGGWHGLPAVHLDYIGHADVTDRLLSVDPEWNWEPLASDEEGLPLFVRTGTNVPVGLWIRLTVSGVSRLGYGTVEPGAFDPEKQLIGDALRNAAMRFGVGLDLWRKEFDDHSAADTPAPIVSESRPAPQQAAPQAPGGALSTSRVQLLAAVMAMPPAPRMTILNSFGYRGSALNAWIGQLDEDVVDKLADAISGGNGDVDPDSIPF